MSDMENRSACFRWAVLLWLLLAALNVAPAEEVKKYFGQGDGLELRPGYASPIKNILWKHNTNLVVEWAEDIELTYFGSFKDRAELDKVTGKLVLKNMKKEDEGSYTLEINDRVQDQTYSVKMIDKVPMPHVDIKPLACDIHSDSCDASCVAEKPTEGAEPITYSWKEDEGEWKRASKVLVITKVETKHVKEFSCQMENPISVAHSGPKKNPLHEPRSVLVIVIVVVVLLVLVLIAVGVGIWCWKTRPEFLSNLLNRRGADITKDSTSNELTNKDPNNSDALLPADGANRAEAGASS